MDYTSTIIVSVAVGLIFAFIIKPKKDKQAAEEKKNTEKERLENTDEHGVEYSADKQTLIKGPSNLTAYTIPVGVSNIQDCAFQGRNELQSINLGTIYHIGDNAFQGCTNLKTIVFPKHMGSIGAFAFANCKSLQEVTIPYGIASIPKNIFSGCNGLQSITLPESISQIKRDAFYQCESLNKIIIPKGSMERFKKLIPKDLADKLIES